MLTKKKYIFIKFKQIVRNIFSFKYNTLLSAKIIIETNVTKGYWLD